MSDIERMVSAADRIESAAHRMAILFEDGYGGNGARLLEAMETDVSDLRAKLQAAEARIRELEAELARKDFSAHAECKAMHRVGRLDGAEAALDFAWEKSWLLLDGITKDEYIQRGLNAVCGEVKS